MAWDANDRSIAAFTMLGHGLVHWFEMSIPILLVVWLRVFPESVTFVGLIVALGFAPFGLGALPAGVLADRYGPHRLVLVCFAGMTLSFLALAVAPSIYAVGLALILWGVAASVYHPAGMALISTGAKERGSVFAWHGIAGNAGIALGPFTTATLLIVFDWHVVAAVLAVPGVVALLYGMRAEFDPTAAVADGATDSAPDSDTDGTAVTPRTVFGNSKQLFASAFVVVFALVTVEGLFYRGVLTYLPEILQGLDAMGAVTLGAGLDGIEPADYLFVGLLVVGMAGQYVGGKLTDRIAVERGLLALFVLLAALALVFVPVSEFGLLGVVAVCGLLGFCLFAIQPFYQVAVALYTPPETRGLSYGFTYLAEFGFGAASIAIGGALLDRFSLAAFFGVLAAFALTGAGLALLLLVGRDRLPLLARQEQSVADS
jgi:MFS family permease